MDLSFSRFEFDTPLAVLPRDLAVMMVGIAARQAASPTARFQSRLATGAIARNLFAPADGCFNASVAAAITGWKGV